MRLNAGTRLGPYEILSALGTGGMAEVYRARDTRLGRDVALKVVTEALATDPELVRRFEKEARIAGSLNHPNLVAVYDVGTHEGSPYLVTELLEGESLRHRLSRGRIPLATALDLGAQIGRALAVAHAHGVVHRDIKPDNLFIASSGPLKVIDFGIAKLAEAAPANAPHGLMDATLTPTGRGTRSGLVLGTPGYMSPEQLRAEPVDSRTDLFSLGAVLHEMLSGQRAFPGRSIVESGHAILHDEPALLPPDVPANVAEVVKRCLEKDPAHRFQSAADLAFALESLRKKSGHPPRPEIPRRHARLLRWGVGVGAIIVLASVTGVSRLIPAARPLGPAPEVEQVTFRWGRVDAARFLPDGRVVFSAAFEGRPEEIFVRPSGSPAAQMLGLEDVRLLGASPGSELALLLHPRFSQSLTRQGTLARVPSVGGTPREVAKDAEYADWSPGGELAVVRQVGTNRVLETPPGHVVFQTTGWISNPRFSRAGDRLGFLHHPVPDDDLGEVMVSDLKGRVHTLTPRLPSAFGLAWGPEDSEVWFTAGQFRKNLLSAVSPGGGIREMYRGLSEIRLDDVDAAGNALITNQVARIDLVYAGDGTGPQRILSWSDWIYPLAALSADGKVLFSALETLEPSRHTQSTSVILRATEGEAVQILGEGYALDLSPDGRWALVGSLDLKELTAIPTGVGEPRSIPTGGLEIAAARWMPDGDRILVVGRTPGADQFSLFRLMRNAGPERISGVALSGRRLLQLAPDARWAAVTDPALRLVIVSLQNGEFFSVPGLGPEACAPRGWMADGSLWVTVGGFQAGARARLVRLEPRTGRIFEERSIGPADPGGAGNLLDVTLSRDGRKVAFTYSRAISSLAIVRGLPR